jgi:hypothetical protein
VVELPLLAAATVSASPVEAADRAGAA